ncbi:hypothetical protein Tco_0227965 [Tanacetum coccineum]
MRSNEETNAAGTDTRPPMLVESDYDSWKIRIHRKKLDSEFSEDENKLEMLILKLKSFLVKRLLILSMGFPKAYSNPLKQPASGASRQEGDMLTTAEEKDMLLGSVIEPKEKDGLLSTSKIKRLQMEAKEKGDVFSMRTELMHSSLIGMLRTL